MTRRSESIHLLNVWIGYGFILLRITLSRPVWHAHCVKRFPLPRLPWPVSSGCPSCLCIPLSAIPLINTFHLIIPMNGETHRPGQFTFAPFFFTHCRYPRPLSTGWLCYYYLLSSIPHLYHRQLCCKIEQTSSSHLHISIHWRLMAMYKWLDDTY